jgi:hypothetical protein
MPSNLTRHALQRCLSRRIPTAALEAAFDYGLCRFTRGAVVYTLGWREVRCWARRGVELSRWEGIEVVVGHDGRIITAYRNQNPRAMRDRDARLAA